MPRLSSDHFNWMLYNGVGTAIGLGLVLLLLLLVTGPARHKIRWTLLFLAAHIVLLLLRLPLGDENTEEPHPIRTTLEFGAYFFLYSAVGLSVFLLLTQSRLSRTFVRPLPQIFLDVAQGFVYALAFLLTLGVMGVKPAELFAGSAILTAVIGLSLRDTLGNLFAGLAIQAQRPFEVGDWIQFNQDSSQIGQVTEINWRATTVLTADRAEVIVPNALLAMAPIVNFSRQGGKTRRSVFVHAPYGVPPQRVQRVIRAALVDAPGVLSDPAPAVVTFAFDERGVQYAVRFWISDFGLRTKLEGAVRDRIWYALGREGIDIPPPARSVRMQKAGKRTVSLQEEGRVARQEQALCHVDFFNHLPEEPRRRLAALARTRLYAEQEVIIRQGDPGDDMFLIETGEVAVTLDRPDEPTAELARLGPGSFFGEMSLLTGEPRSATVRATRECEVLVVGKSAFAQILATSPDLAEHVAQTITHRRSGLNSKLADHSGVHPHVAAEHHHRLLERIKEFFSV
jgi:small-conductance mechanosensitive channel/CRP-like cAMP-binding protein